MLERNFISYNDIDYKKLDEIISGVQFVKKNNRKTTESIANIAVSFDTETTSTYANNEKVAFTYFWQFGFTDNFYCYGRYWPDFVKLCVHIAEKLKANYLCP